MIDRVVCLGCGGELGVQGGCTCPPPSVLPASHASGHPYRSLVDAAPCPRCGGRLDEEDFHDVRALDCRACHGLFLDRATIEKLSEPEGESIRLAFPKRARRPEDADVRYLACPLCQTRMNRTAFARVSGVIVDVCKDHGVWFDCGEVNAIIEFVESGGLERERAKQRFAHDEENARLRAEYQRVHGEAEAAAGRNRSSWNRVDLLGVSPSLVELLGGSGRRSS